MSKEYWNTINLVHYNSGPLLHTQKTVNQIKPIDVDTEKKHL